MRPMYKIPVKKIINPILRNAIKVQPKQKLLQNRQIIIKQKILPKSNVQKTNAIINPLIKPKIIDLRRNNNVVLGKRRERKETIIKDENFYKVEHLKGRGIGRILVMIGCGPSVNEVDFKPILNNSRIETMVINKPYPPVWPSNYWAFCDNSQYQRNKEEFDKYNGLLLNSVAIQKRKSNQIIIRPKSYKEGRGFSLNLCEGYFIGRSSIYANMQTAHWMGYEKIYIFGIDMCEIPGKPLHAYGTNPDVDPKIRKSRFKFEAEHYLWAAENLPTEIKNKFVICSSYNPWPFANKFPRLDHKIAIDGILKEIKSKWG
jgi:hypothetical protein